MGFHGGAGWLNCNKLQHEAPRLVISCLWGLKWSSSGRRWGRGAADGATPLTLLNEVSLQGSECEAETLLSSAAPPKREQPIRSVSCSIFTPDFYSNISTTPQFFRGFIGTTLPLLIQIYQINKIFQQIIYILMLFHVRYLLFGFIWISHFFFFCHSTHNHLYIIVFFMFQALTHTACCI